MGGCSLPVYIATSQVAEGFFAWVVHPYFTLRKVETLVKCGDGKGEVVRKAIK